MRFRLDEVVPDDHQHVARPAPGTRERPLMQRPHAAIQGSEPVERHQRAPFAPLALDADRVALEFRGVAVVATVDSLRAHKATIANQRGTEIRQHVALTEG
jgi:hypothetical protein